MGLYREWKNILETPRTRDEQMAFWDDFCKKETEIYRDILGKSQKNVSGIVSQLAEGYGVSDVYFMGFLDGINESIACPLDLESVERDSAIDIEIDFEKLYYNMLAVPAEWLYTLPEWDSILDREKRKEISKMQKRDKTIVKGEKIGRNDPCPCGSGLKYKRCCGA